MPTYDDICLCKDIQRATIRALSDLVTAHGGNLPVMLYWHPVIKKGIETMDEAVTNGQVGRCEKGQAYLVKQAQRILGNDNSPVSTEGT